MTRRTRHDRQSRKVARPKPRGPGTPPVGRPAGPSADTDAWAVHEHLRALHGIGNELRLKILDVFAFMLSVGGSRDLGYASFDEYCAREFGLSRGEAHEYALVAVALGRLPRLRALFGQGALSWDQTRAIARVATSATEGAWLDLAMRASVSRLVKEVGYARRTGRDAPRERRLGQPDP